MAENQTQNKSVSGEVELKNSILDHNASWVLMFVYLGYLIGIYFAQRATYTAGVLTSDISTYSYFLVSMIVGLVVTCILYNLGKVIFASLAGYRVVYFEILGIVFNQADPKKTHVSFHISNVFDLALRFAPKDDDTKKNPRLIFFGGYAMEVMILIVSIVIFFVLGFGKPRGTITNVAYYVLFSMLYGFLTPLYELLPFRQDYPTDMFNLIVTASKEDQEAYNIYSINRRRELSGEDYLLKTYPDFGSFYKAHLIYPLYLDDLYASRLEKAYEDLSKMKYYSKYYLEEERYLAPSEMVYLKYLIDDKDGASKAFFDMKSDDRKSLVKAPLFSNYRMVILVDSYIHNSLDSLKDLLASMKKRMEEYDVSSHRVEKEIELSKKALELAKKNPNITFPEDVVVPALETNKAETAAPMEKKEETPSSEKKASDEEDEDE